MSSRARLNNVIFWIGAAGILAGGVGICLVKSTHWLKFFDNLHWTASAVSAALICWLGIDSPPKAPDSARWWLAVGISAYAIGQLVWDIQALIGYNAFPSPSDLFYLWLGPCLAIGIYRGSVTALSAPQRKLFLIDCAILVTAALSLVLVLYLPKRGETTWLAMTVLIAYPTSLLAALGMAIISLPTLKLRPNAAMMLFLAALTAISWSWMTWNNLVLEGLIYDGAWFNFSFSIGIFSLGCASSELVFQPWQHRRWQRHCEAAIRLLPLLAVVTSALAVIAAHWLDGIPGIIIDITHFGALIVVILATIRQYTLLREYDQLLIAEQTLSQEQLFSDSIIEGLPGAFVLLDASGQILKHNSRLSRDLIEPTAEQPPPISLLVSARSIQMLDQQLGPIFAHGAGELELELKQAGGEFIPHGFSFRRIDFNNASYLMGIGIDISPLKSALATLEESRQLLQQIIETIPMRIFWKDRQSRYLGCNTLFATDAGLTNPVQIIGKSDFDLAWKQQAEFFQSDDALVMASGQVKAATDETLCRPDGNPLHIRVSKAPLRNASGELLGVLGIFDDISERRQLEAMPKLAALVFEHSREAIMVSDEHNRILTVNPAFSRLTGYRPDEVIGKKPHLLHSGKHDNSFYQTMWRNIREHDFWEGEIWDKRKNGEIYPQRLSISVIRRPDGTIYRHVAIGADISDSKQAEEMLWRQANFDILTQLPNRQMFFDHLLQELKRARRNRHKLAVLFLDLDHFKDINDSLGHQTGDQLLIQASLRMRHCVRESDTLARLGGDEFAVLIPRAELEDIERVCNHILEQMAQPFQLNTDLAYVSTSIGIAFYPDDGQDAEELLKKADQAMYAAKAAGRGRFHYFKQDMQERAMLHLRLASDMRNGLAAGEFALYFQPIVDLASGRVDKAEALLRWRHPLFGFIPPSHFIPIAESTGFIHEIGNWIFAESINWSRHWSQLRQQPFVNSVNLSPVQLMRGNTTDSWPERFKAAELGVDGLVLEITEGVLLNDNHDVSQKLLQLRQAGMQISLDDFGTGYSSLSYLNKLPIDYLKIDKSFTSEIVDNAACHAMVEAIIVMAHKLNLKVIAEGVENQAQRQLLLDAGCDFAQGYLYAGALPPVEFETRFIRQHDA